MRCAWQALLNLIPVWMRHEVDKYKDTLQELRIRLNLPVEIVANKWTGWIERPASIEDIRFCINIASRYSPWTASSISDGYITCAGGHRIGLCGEIIYEDEHIKGISVPRSLCIRVARDIPSLSKGIDICDESILIIGCPGSGKTTLLRDLIRRQSDSSPGCVAVVDERGEVFPYYQNIPCFYSGKRTDVLTGCKKSKGIEMVLRCMGPSVIAVDEITAQEDCQSLIHAGWCGVKLIATAHASDKNDLLNRPVYRPVVETGLFHHLIVLRPDKTWREERMCL